MEILATFPTVRAGVLDSPGETGQDFPLPIDPAAPRGRMGGARRRGRRGLGLPSRSVTILGLVAAAVWAAVWAVEWRDSTALASKACAVAARESVSERVSR